MNVRMLVRIPTVRFMHATRYSDVSLDSRCPEGRMRRDNRSGIYSTAQYKCCMSGWQEESVLPGRRPSTMVRISISSSPPERAGRRERANHCALCMVQHLRDAREGWGSLRGMGRARVSAAGAPAESGARGGVVLELVRHVAYI